jgi:hypothetical protein
MKKFSSICSILIIAFLFMTATAFSSPFSYKVTNDIYSGTPNGIPTASTGNDMPDIYEAINKIMGTTYLTNAAVDHLFMDNDSLWLNFGSRATVIGYSAVYHNTLGVYTAGGSHTVLTDQYGFGFADGSDPLKPIPYPTASIGVPDGTVFGWYLEVWNSNKTEYKGTYYSESNRNPDGYDHMMTFDLGGPLDFNKIHYENPCLIAWEDYSYSLSSFTLGDEDYNDLIFLVDAKPVPEPATMLLLGSGLLGLAGLGRKRKRAFKSS